MKLQPLAALSLGLFAQACVAPRQPAPAQAPPVPRPQPAVPIVPAPPLGWRDAPLTPGGWRYEAGSLRSTFAGGLFSVQCDRAGRVVVMTRQSGGAALTIATGSGSRTLVAQSGAATLSARDPLLDQIAFSRGRFAVEAPGEPRLVIPAWPEFARVVEDCRG